MKIWRFGQIREDWPVFRKEKRLSFNWLDAGINYKKIKSFKKFNGWTCIQPWIEEIKKGDLIFIINKSEYAGVAIIGDTYRYKKYDIKIDDYKLPGLPVKFLHMLKTPITHNIQIEAQSPKTFYRICGIGFNLFKVMEFIRTEYPSTAKKIEKYIYNNAKAEEDKISRICWNDRDWKGPSGPTGKNKSRDTFEGENGFGFEEWINVKSRIVNGYHYSFLQTLGLISDEHVDKIYNIALIMNDIYGNRYLAGIIKNGICISKEESTDIYEIYSKNKWLKEMGKEIESVNGNSSYFNNQEPEYLFNIKFKSNDIIIYDESYPLEDDYVSTFRYKLLDADNKNLSSILNEEIDLDEGNLKSTSKIKRGGTKGGTYDPTHNKMQNKLAILLRRKTNIYNKVQIEKGRVDVKARTLNGKWHYYEIKTCGTAKKSIRAALGQIMEYAYWPNIKKADKLVIVSEIDPGPSTRKYMKYLRNKFSLQVYYQSFKLPDKLGELV